MAVPELFNNIKSAAEYIVYFMGLYHSVMDYEIQTGAIAEPTTASKGNGHVVVVYNSDLDRVYLWVRCNGDTDWQLVTDVAVKKNSGAIVGIQPALNFIEGANITLTIANDAVNQEVDITIAAAGGGDGDQDIFYPAPDPDDYKGTYASMLLLDDQVVLVRQTFYLPSNYVGADGWGVHVIVIPDGTGNLRWGVSTNFAEVCNDEGYQTHTDSIALGQSAVTADEVECLDISDGLTGALAGDLVGIEFTRDAEDALDTVDDEVHYVGIILRAPGEE